MNILGIETSCDETSVAIVQNGRHVLVNNTISQIELHKEFGGIKPSVAKFAHEEVIDSLIDKTINESKINIKSIDSIAVTIGPGLVIALLVGFKKAKELAKLWNKKLIGVNHLYGHICSNYLESDLEPPFVCLLASGGHTQIIDVKSFTDYEIMGSTLDDACGEAFDKVGRLLGLPYPGGPHLEQLAKNGNPNVYKLPEGKVGDYDFSFSGLKTAVLYLIRKLPEDFNKADLAASFQECATNTLVKKIIKAAKDKNLNKIVMAGGVSANQTLRKKLKTQSSKLKASLYMPNLKYCTDNAAMIASAGYFMKDVESAIDKLDVFAKDPLSRRSYVRSS
ncbi:MAG: tRNA (adenosine(37)-N6)-threonylcarbamoyltransferase complex transferase subunit TsaD [Candidatus Melainabacteria bacterium]|nr:tRNA (adenosine(37)-N6)-threonylcarbamoyltransferase complex transferase subunit TsaD [Candidatus Melainabacteria bacterium]MBI3309646.1 tRNA (adenosine(37)-N6)-threonylcarbamoyltransferase complex transferase subunit TsaD [Candidatus Melainabacteria bacterium]